MIKRVLIQKGYRAYTSLVSKVPNGWAPLPALIIFKPTYRCNLRCKMCAFYGPGGKVPDSSEELDTKQIEKLFGNIREAYKFSPYKPHIGMVGGGELFVREDIFDIFKIIAENGFKYSITTNASLLDKERVGKLLAYPPKEVRISIDGCDALHDSIRGVPGTFERAVGAIKLIDGRVPVKINCVIVEDNIPHLSEMVKLASELGVELSFQHLVFADKNQIEAHKKVGEKMLGEVITARGIPEIKPSGKYSLELVVKLNEAKELAKKLGVKLSFVPRALSDSEVIKYYSDLSWTHSKRCSFPWGAARITQKGELFACMDYYFGDLKKEKFAAVWNGGRAKKFRIALGKIRYYPGCVRCCHL